MSPPDSAAETKNDHHAEFVQLFLKHEPRVYAFIRSMVPDRTDADEVFQETAVVAWRKFSEFELGSNFAGWLSQIAYWEVRSLRKRKSRDMLVFSQTVLDAIVEDTVEMRHELESVRTMLGRCIRKLKPRDREVFRLRYMHQAKIREVAEQLGRPLETIHSAVKRVRRQLTQCIERRLAAEYRS